MLDICEDYFLYRGWTYARLDGATTRPRRALDIRLFNQKNSRTSPSGVPSDISLSMLSDQH
jgi:SNF2 family DNA or RNA helicase